MARVIATVHLRLRTVFPSVAGARPEDSLAIRDAADVAIINNNNGLTYCITYWT